MRTLATGAGTDVAKRDLAANAVLASERSIVFIAVVVVLGRSRDNVSLEQRNNQCSRGGEDRGSNLTPPP